MSNAVLVTYATRCGSTAGVAEAIAKTLAEGGAAVELRPMQEVKDVAPYSAVVAGSAIRDGKWLPEAMEFVQKHRAALARKPFAPFLVCMTLAMPNRNYQAHVAIWLDPVRALVPPVSVGLFAGALDISKLRSFKERLMFRMSVAMGVWKEGDHRDWDAIRSWAREVRGRIAA
jgi:menaquinone-dependent protoporphyrinogen oxidase